ncbi:MAG: FxsA family protein [Pseudomonadales bacterium]
MRFLFLFFMIVPIAEMWILIEVGQWLGALPTIALVMLTAVIGISLLRWQGLSTLTRAQQRMQNGQMPAQEMIEGLALAIGGALLLTPGFMTDAFGFACLIPASRRKLAALAVAQFSRSRMTMYSESYTQTQRDDSHFGDSPSEPPTVIEGEYKKVDD